MKELSIEEKARRYDEAIERAREYVSKDDVEVTEYIFPELADSDDERIRKLIIKHFKEIANSNEQSWISLDIPYILDWLEKQGEQKYNTDFSDLRTWKYIVDAVLTEKEGIGQYLDSPFTEEVAKKLQKKFGKIEQKTAEWHREDEQNLNACLGFIPDEFLRRWLTDAIHAKYDNHTWSEEDETVLNNLIYALANDRIGNDRDEYISYLKSLKDRNTWKPSDEQMKGIECAIKTLQHQLNVGDKRLNSLYDNLKKLKE